jgi:hypothetical protein
MLFIRMDNTKTGDSGRRLNRMAYLRRDHEPRRLQKEHPIVQTNSFSSIEE